VQDREERRIEVFFEKGVLEATTDLLVGAPEDSLLRKAVSGPAERPDPAELLRDMYEREGVDPDRTYWVYQYLAHRAFAHAVQAGDPPSPGMTDALHAHRLVEAAYRAAAGRPVATSELDP
jgi:predicted dehydrogenase